MTPRPYIKKKIDELEALYAESTDNPETLRALHAELKLRSTPRAVKLCDKIVTVLANAGKQKASSSKSSHTLDPQPTPAPLHQESTSAAQQDLFETSDAPKAGKSTRSHTGTTSAKTSRTKTTVAEETETGHRGVMRPPGNIPGTQEPMVFPLDKTLQLDVPKDAQLATRYAAAIKELIKEMKKEGAAVRQVLLRDGRSVTLDSQDAGYEFRYEDEADLFEGAAITASVNGMQADGKIVAIDGRRLLVSLSASFGPHIDTCILRVDNTAMLEALRSRLVKIGQGSESGFNRKLADAVVANTGEAIPAGSPPQGTEKLNGLQREAVGGMLANEIYYLWGPPGTGKTETLSALALVLMDDNKRLMVCSNTNQAVDQILLKLCKRFGLNHPIVNDGGIIRVGAITHNELDKDWSAMITVDGIVERRSLELRQHRNVLQEQLGALNRAAVRATETVAMFQQFDKLQTEVERCRGVFDKAVKAQTLEVDRKRGVVKRLQELEVERVTVIGANALRRFILRSLDKIERDLATVRRQLSAFDDSIPDIQARVDAAEHLFKASSDAVAPMQQALVGLDRSKAERELAGFDDRRRPLVDELAEINRQLDDIRKAVLDGARIVGVTVTKAYLSAQMFSAFDVVVIDEASMVMLPALYHAAGMAKEKVIISGDSKQLAPIVPTKQQAIFDAIGNSVFTTAKIGLGRGAALKRTTLLEVQYRMDDHICKLITGMYGGKLRTGTVNGASSDRRLPMPELFNSTLTIIDTSPVAPFVSRDAFKSRYNLMNALVVRNVCRHLEANGCLADSGDLGVATPYAAQAKLLQQVLVEFGDTLQAGTVHRYQGDEKHSMVLDIPDSLGEQRAGYFLEATYPDHPGALLFNVGISRAKRHLIVCANLSYLDRKLPGTANLREILFDMQRSGNVVDVRDVLALYPVINDLRKLGRSFNLSADAERHGLFNGREFDEVFIADLEQARHSIAIYSGFVTPQRVASYESLFRRKLAEGVRIRCVTRPPRRNGSIPPEDGTAALDALERMGCVVDTRGDIHEKAALIDEEVFWFGSLNPLSYSLATSESMVRAEGEMFALTFAALASIERGVKAEKMKGATTQAENPRCELCGSRTAWMKGPYGPYWDCESNDCTWSQNHLARRRTTGQQRQGPDEAPRTCGKCGLPMKLKNGRYGDFYGCSGYPGCRNIAKA